MFVYSLKASSLKLIGVILACAMIVSAAMLVFPDHNAEPDTVSTFTAKNKISYSGIDSEEKLLAFINSFGIRTAAVPLEKTNVEIPSKFDAVLEEYESLQREQGLKLSKYKGKTVTRYTYEILNYPKDENGQPAGKVFLNLVLYKDRVIGGDICSAEMGGFVKPFTDFSPELPAI